MQKHGLNLSNRVLSENMYQFVSKTEISLKDKILCYYNGLNWKIVPLDIFLRYPVLHDKYFEEDDSKGEIITVALCPFTLATCVFLGKYTPSEYLINSSLVLTDEKSNLLPIISGFATDPDNYTSKVKRWESFIKIFRNAISEYPDSQFITLNQNMPHQLINNDYYNNDKIFYPTNSSKYNIHPKTLVYVVQYKSSKSLSDKYSIIIGQDANESEPTGYNVKDSGLLKYIDQMKFKFSEKSAFLIPQLWFSCLPLYPTAKIVSL